MTPAERRVELRVCAQAVARMRGALIADAIAAADRAAAMQPISQQASKILKRLTAGAVDRCHIVFQPNLRNSTVYAGHHQYAGEPPQVGGIADRAVIQTPWRKQPAPVPDQFIRQPLIHFHAPQKREKRPGASRDAFK
ncbi:hypothetical protein [Motiliproteus sp. SC1-56]|uniref:hypothetical protein n=1 Tax=Motiliproteus sp. SC1-56 TaxID=2799565 RepID=UPI001A8E19C9|nr:hypothetical protein [Motiliproteus sp. SC1-56]